MLIIDDAYFMRNLLKKALKEAGYEVIGEAKDGKEGVKLYFELHPDIVTMDIKMPEMDGIEATKQIISKDPKAMIIVVTGNTDDQIKNAILHAGAKEYLQKPFQPAFLWAKIDRLFASAEPIDDSNKDPVFVQNTHELPSIPFVEEGIEDDFEMTELELASEPDPEKTNVIEIENENDVILFPETYRVEEEDVPIEHMIDKSDMVYDKERSEESSYLSPNPLSTVPKKPIPVPHHQKEEESVMIRPPRGQIQKDHTLTNWDEDEDLEEPVIDMTSGSIQPEKKESLLSAIKKIFKKS